MAQTITNTTYEVEIVGIKGDKVMLKTLGDPFLDHSDGTEHEMIVVLREGMPEPLSIGDRITMTETYTEDTVQ